MQYAVYLRGETHVKHAIGFIQHQYRDVIELYRVLLNKVKQAAGSGHNDARFLFKVQELAGVVFTAYKHNRLHSQKRGELLEYVVYLYGKLARGHKYQPFALPGGQGLYQWYGKRDGFAGAGLRYAHHVIARAGYGYGLFLYGGRHNKFHAVQGFKQFRGDTQPVKARHRNGRLGFSFYHGNKFLQHFLSSLIQVYIIRRRVWGKEGLSLNNSAN